jgi:sulfite reductase (NADPH) hemoprotein beta-component
MHPEFSFLPRKFKVAVTGAPSDRAALAVHDIGVRIVRNEAGEIGFEILVGGGQGRTPMLAKTVRPFVEKQHLLSYLEAILRVYNEYGRRDNLFKARIKILVHEIGIDEFRARVEDEWMEMRGGSVELPQCEHDRITAYFSPPPLEDLPPVSLAFEHYRREDADFARWSRINLVEHRQAGYAIVNLSLKPTGGVPGDATAEQMHAIAELADSYSFGEIRVTHEQNLTFPHVRQSDLYALWRALGPLGLATPNIGQVTDIIACPGLDYCSLANARSIPIAQRITERFDDIARVHKVGELKIKISGCINACGHHHVGHIGILGVDKKGEEFYQITLGGDATETAALGAIVGPAFAYDDVTDAVETLVNTYVDLRQDGERFLDTYRRVGLEPFKEKLYAAH